MPGDTPDLKPEVSAEVEVSESSLRAKLNLPANLASSIGANLVKAVGFAAAGAAPEWYLRTKDTLATSRLLDAITVQLCARMKDSAEREKIAQLLKFSILETETRLQRREEIIYSAKSEIPYFADQVSAEQDAAISDEFLSRFWDVADKISSESMKEVFARILASEVSSPGGFSPSTLNFLSTMHPELARSFDLLCTMTFSFENMDFVIISVTHGEHPGTKPNSVGWMRKIGQQLFEFGVPREALLELRSAGLIRSLPEEEYPDLTEFYEATEVEFAGSKVRFRIQPDAPAEPGFSAPDATNVVSLTRAGSEIRRILELRPHPDYKEQIREVMKIGRIALEDLVDP